MNNPQNQLDITVARTVRAQDGSLHFNLKSDFESIWITQADFHKNEKDVISQIADRLSVKIFTTQAKNELKNLIQNHPVANIEEGIVATQQGYVTPEIYVHANGDITQSSSNEIQPIVVFNLDECGGTNGTLGRWKRRISKAIYGNEFATFVLCFGFCPLLLNFVPSRILNPYLDIVGRKLSGKSILGSMAASIYGGDPQSEIGYGRNWDATDGAFPELKRQHSHGLLFLDENNIQGESLRQNGRIAFIQSSTDERKRMGESKRKQPVRMALLSTGNKMPDAATTKNKDEVEAAASRVMTLKFDQRILNECPPEFNDTKEAARFLRQHIDEHYGHASRKFVQHVVDANEVDKKEFEKKIEVLMGKGYKKAKSFPDLDDRIVDTIALSYAAGILAKKWNMLPNGCSKVSDAAEAVMRKLTDQNLASASPELQRIMVIISENEHCIKTYEKDARPNKTLEGNGMFASRTPISDNQCQYCFHPEKLRAKLGPDHTAILQGLRDKGYLKAQTGASKKLLYTAPVCVPFKKQIYMVTIPE